jgi:hypothetical protein
MRNFLEGLRKHGNFRVMNFSNKRQIFRSVTQFCPDVEVEWSVTLLLILEILCSMFGLESSHIVLYCLAKITRIPKMLKFIAISFWRQWRYAAVPCVLQMVRQENDMIAVKTRLLMGEHYGVIADYLDHAIVIRVPPSANPIVSTYRRQWNFYRE